MAFMRADISRGGATSASYRVSKAALNMLTKCFAVEHANECIHIAIHPGISRTICQPPAEHTSS